MVCTGSTGGTMADGPVTRFVQYTWMGCTMADTVMLATTRGLWVPTARTPTFCGPLVECSETYTRVTTFIRTMTQFLLLGKGAVCEGAGAPCMLKE